MMNNGIDERIEYQLNVFSKQAFNIVLVLLFLDFMIKIYLDKPSDQYISSALIFFIGVFYYGIRCIVAKLPLGPYKLKNNRNEKYIRMSMSVLVIIFSDILMKYSFNKIIFDSIKWLIFVNIMLFVFDKVNKKTQ
ncbi:hypothetical protein LI053_16145 [Clostridium perfringens]|uniref:DUF6773 family protein n=1 Tax=Clostridium perfringens TaxID=1502 RepID=UPI0022468500|nr:DUF6773 family protein [Clostridium perfringens]MCX0386972.1 hypothetical protein [Clostridium perfringens]